MPTLTDKSSACGQRGAQNPSRVKQLLLANPLYLNIALKRYDIESFS